MLELPKDAERGPVDGRNADCAKGWTELDVGHGPGGGGGGYLRERPALSASCLGHP